MSKEMTNESFNDRRSITDNSSVHDASTSRYRPLRITEIDASDSDEEEEEIVTNENDTEDDDEDKEDIQTQPPNSPRHSEIIKKDPEIQGSLIKLPSTSLLSEAGTSFKSSPPIQQINSTLAWQNYSKDKQTLTTVDKKIPIESQSAHRFTTDFSKMDIDESKLDFVPNFKTSVDQVKLKSDQQVSPPSQLSSSSSSTTHSVYHNRRSNVKLEMPDLSQTSQERQNHGKIIYKADNPPPSAHKLINKIEHSVLNIPPSDNHPVVNSTQTNFETPMKHQPPVGSMRPVPSHSNRNIYQTPQSRTQSDHVINTQTPSARLSMWPQDSFMRTPIQTRGPEAFAGQTPGVSSVHKTHTSRSRNGDAKNVRRPLTETTSSEHRVINENYYPHAVLQKEHVEQSGSHSRRAFEQVQDIPRRTITAVNQEIMENPQKISPVNTSGFKENPRQTMVKQEIMENNYQKISPPNQDFKNNFPKVSQKNVELKENQHPSSVFDPVKKSVNYQTDNSVSKLAIVPQNLPSLSVVSKPPQQQQQQKHDNYQNQQNNQPKQLNIQASVSINQNKPQIGGNFIVQGKKYLILGSLGNGMSGYVYRVQDLETYELRAIKIVDLKPMDKENAASCIEEIKLLTRLQAPCVIKMYDCEKRDNVIYTVMEMGDTDLSRFLREIANEKTEKRLPLTMILYYWTEMLTAVKHIHDNGVIHSDLKPANFLLVRGRLKLIDFGISSTLNADMTSVVKSSTVGTLNYISPEALVDTNENFDSPDNNDTSPNHKVKYKINFKSDVWSLGCILYGMVYGQPPFAHIKHQWTKITSIIDQSNNISFKPTKKSGQIPSVLIDVIRSCLQKDQRARPSVEQLLQVEYTSLGSAPVTKPDIPPNILRKIKGALVEDEWRQFVESMEK